jgi:hypothetical protein
VSHSYERANAEDASPSVRRAYRALLGNDYERSLMDHITFSSLANVYGPDFESAWVWQRAGLDEVTRSMPPHSYLPLVITNEGSAVVPHEVWFGPHVGKKLAEFVAMLGAEFLVASYSSSSGRATEHYTLRGTDGFTAREAHWSVEHKMFGRRQISPMRRGEGKRKNTLTAIPASADPTVELPPWEDELLGDVAFELRENRSAGT